MYRFDKRLYPDLPVSYLDRGKISIFLCFINKKK